MIYSTYPAWVLGFHGCDQSVCTSVIEKHTHLIKSNNDYDWLGHGVYFWENNPLRAYEFALEQKKAGKIKNPAVIGAIIDLKNCLDMTDLASLRLVSRMYEFYKIVTKIEGTQMASNSGSGTDRPLRKLDCAVIETLHTYVESNENYLPYDSVRGAFFEGKELFAGSGFREKDHIQLCIRKQDCIKGYFDPLMDIKSEYFNSTT